MKTSELLEYLQKFPAESAAIMIVIDRGYRQYTTIATVHLMADRGRPMLTIELTESVPLEETLL